MEEGETLIEEFVEPVDQEYVPPEDEEEAFKVVEEPLQILVSFKPILTLKGAGFSARDLKNAGYSLKDLKDADRLFFSYKPILIGGAIGALCGGPIGLAVGAVTIRSAKSKNLVPAAVVGKLLVATFALLFVESFILAENDLIIVPLMCILCVAIPFVLVTIAPRFITAAEVNLFFLLETILGPIWVWLVIKEQPTIETIFGGSIIILTIGIHSFLALKKT